MAPRETENNAYAKFWGDKQRALWHVMVFLEWSIGNEQIKQIKTILILWIKNCVKLLIYGVEIMNSKRQAMGKLGHVVQIRVCRLT